MPFNQASLRMSLSWITMCFSVTLVWWPRVAIGKLLRFYQFQSLFLYLIFQRKNKRKIKLDWNLLVLN